MEQRCVQLDSECDIFGGKTCRRSTGWVRLRVHTTADNTEGGFRKRLSDKVESESSARKSFFRRRAEAPLGHTNPKKQTHSLSIDVRGIMSLLHSVPEDSDEIKSTVEADMDSPRSPERARKCAVRRHRL